MDNMKGFDKKLTIRHKCFQVSGKKIFYYREIPSTNKTARTLAIQGEPEGAIVMSAYQSSGVGRLNRDWICPAGTAVTMSLVLRPKIGIKAVPQLTLLCGVAVADTVKAFVGHAGIKWPNDVLAGGKKVCGILAQSGSAGRNGHYVIMGIGLNVNQTAGQLPENCRDIATSLRIENGGRVSRMDVLDAFIKYWDRHYAAFQEEGFAYLYGEWVKRNLTLGRRVSITDGGKGLVEGVAKDISDKGGILIEFSDGGIKEYTAEDLSFGRSFYTAAISRGSGEQHKPKRNNQTKGT